LKEVIYPWLKGAKEYDFTDIKEGLRLHLNESPYPPPDFVLEAVTRYLKAGNRYQHPDLSKRFRELAAEYNGVEPDEIFPTTGGDGAIRSVFYNFTQPGDVVLSNYPGYSMYSVYSSFRGLREERVNLREAGDWWQEDMDSLLSKADRSRLVVIDDPNNPTGSPMLQANEDKIKALAERVKGIVLLDEAYYEFSGYTASKLVSKYPNLVIVRTLSKAFSLASFRVGYLIADREIVKVLEKGSTPFDVPLPSLIAGITALERPSYAREIASEISGNREYLYRALKSVGLKVYKSVTNFLFFKYRGDLLSPLLKRGIAIRNPIKDFYRVTVGTKEQCDIFVKELGEIIEDSNTEQR